MTGAKDEYRERILTAATQVFADDGFATSSLANIALKAAVAEGTVNALFGTKAGLYVAVLNRQFALVTQFIDKENREPLVPIAEWLNVLYTAMLASGHSEERVTLDRLLRQEAASPSGCIGNLLGEVLKAHHDGLARTLAYEICEGDEVTDDIHRAAKAIIDIARGYIRDRPALVYTAPGPFEGPNWEKAAVTGSVEQALDLIEGCRKRHEATQATKKPVALHTAEMLRRLRDYDAATAKDRMR